jgi:Domain of unknown function (DUF4259)
MGAWGIGSFENDAAGDWTAHFRATPGVHLLRDAFEAVNGTTDYIEVDLGGAAIAAAETLAAAKGSPCRNLPPELVAWAEANAAIATPLLTEAALAAIGRVLDTKASEIAELWAEGEDFAGWRALIEDLKRRLT